MVMNDELRGKIVRQELDLDYQGAHNKVFTAEVKYTPEHIEKLGFFNLCYMAVKKCDIIKVHTSKSGEYDNYYEFLVLAVDKDAKTVAVQQLRKFNFLKPDKEKELKNTADIAKLIEDTEKGLQKQIALLDENIKNLAKQLTELTETVTKYIADTDDQLEEIEANIAKAKTKNN